MSYLFDTDAISEVLRPKPVPAYLHWLMSVHRADQFTSAVVVGELYKGAFGSAHTARHLDNIEKRILPALTVLPYEVSTARVFGQLQAHLAAEGRVITDADLQIAATAIRHDLELVTGNLRHFNRVPGLKINTIFARGR
jgi:predicted nucleic acid-binding protein